MSILPLTILSSSATGYAAVDQPVRRLASGAYQTSLKVSSGVSSGKVQVLCAPLGARGSPSVANAKHKATHVQGILQSSDVYHDDPIISVSAQLNEAITLSSNTLEREVYVQAVSKKSAATVFNTKSRCGGTSSGTCKAKINVADAFKGLATNQAFDVKVGFDTKSLQSIGMVQLIKRAATVSAELKDTVYATLPDKPLYSGDTFVLAIKSRFHQYLKTAGMQIKLGSGLKFVMNSQYPRFPKQAGGDGVFASTKVEANTARTQLFGLVAGRKDGKSAKDLGEPTNEPLFTVLVQVLSGVKDNTTGTVEISSLEEVTDLQEVRLKATQKGALESRTGVANPAKVHFKTDTIIGFFAHTAGPSVRVQLL